MVASASVTAQSVPAARNITVLAGEKLTLTQDSVQGPLSCTVSSGASLTLRGPISLRGTLDIKAEAGSKVVIGDQGDTLRADTLRIVANTARVDGTATLAADWLECSAAAFAIVDLADCRLTGNEPLHTSVDEYSRLLVRRVEKADGSVVINDGTEYVNGYRNYIDACNEGVGTLARLAAGREKRRQWRYNIDFAWGFHNWGREWYDGLGGVTGPAELRTSFNNLQLAFNYPLLRFDRVALYGGIGFEWDKYKFVSPDVFFNTSANPYCFDNGATAVAGSTRCESRLLTRYVTVPVMVKVDLGRHWRLEAGAIAGIHWSGSHTGLRRDIEGDDLVVREKDFSVNSYINPYKLDLRAAVTYRGMGLFFQVPIFSALRSPSEQLYPVKFGIIL